MNTVEEMRKYLQKLPDDLAGIKDVHDELSYRSTHAAHTFAAEVIHHLQTRGAVGRYTYTPPPSAPSQSEGAPSRITPEQLPTSIPSVASQQDLPSPEPGRNGASDDALPPDAPQSAASEPRIRELRSKLLDLTTRNRLLNFKHTARGGRYVRIVDEDPADLFSQLHNDRVVELVGLPDPPDQPDDEESDDFVEALEEAVLTDRAYLKEIAEIEESAGDDADAKIRAAERKLRDKLRRKLGLRSRAEVQKSARDFAVSLGINPDFDLAGSRPRRRRAEKYWQTLLSEDDLARRLRGIEQGAREARQEYGIDTLYFVFGFLEWSPPAVEGKSEEVLFAPLVLYPATIERKARKRDRAGDFLLIEDGSGESSDRRNRYQLAAADADEPAANLTLRERLREDHDIVLPELEPEDPDLERYFAQVEPLIRTFPGWRVRRYVTLTHLSFNRLPMWRDLDPHAAGKLPPHRHRLLGGLFGGRERDDEDDEKIGEESPIEAVVPPLLRDCDSSQYAAIKAALAGRNLVIQGPPGTGKSQTITNLIGALLHQGKSVLFVAEKQAALDVVYKRLADVGLEDFLLQLHSAKAGRKQVIESIRARLLRKAQYFSAAEDQRVRDGHKTTEAELNAYAKTINSPFGALGLTLHDIFWREFQNRDFPELPRLARFSFDGVDCWTKEDYEARRIAIAEWEAIAQERSSHAEITGWDWVNGSDLHVREQKDILHLVRTAGLSGAQLADALREERLTVSSEVSVAGVRALTARMEEGCERPADCPPSLWTLARTPDVEQAGRAIVDALDAITAWRAEIESIAPTAK